MKDPFTKQEVKIAVIGGGTGSFTMLSALKKYTSQIAAIVSMADDGGSTGVLRDEFGTLPPGDIRQCLVALSDSDKLRDLFQYRFETGTFSGHSFGNLLLTALEKMTGDFAEAVDTTSDILRIRGVVIPVTLDDIRLQMSWDGQGAALNGEKFIDAEEFKQDPRKAHLELTPKAQPNPTAIQAIMQADIVVIAPGSLYTSLAPPLIIDGVGEALRKTEATKVYVANLVTKKGQTEGFTVSDHAAEIERFAGGEFLDYVLYNRQEPSEEIAARYKEEGGFMTKVDLDVLARQHYKAVGADLLGDMASRTASAEALGVVRSLIRHDADAAARATLALPRLLS